VTEEKINNLDFIKIKKTVVLKRTPLRKLKDNTQIIEYLISNFICKENMLEATITS
jgi:hypothetical protein